MSLAGEGIVIRRMAAADLPAVLAIAQSLPEAPHWPESAYRNAIGPRSTPHRAALVAAEPRVGSILGFAVASLLPPQAELETIVVAPDSQRQRVGKHLLAALAAELKAEGVHELLLEVRASNHPALAFYRALGFVQTGLRPCYYADPIEDAVLMSRTLAGL